MRAPCPARQPILKLTVEALEDRWLPSAAGSLPAILAVPDVAPALEADSPVLASADINSAPVNFADQGSEDWTAAVGLCAQMKLNAFDALIENVAMGWPASPLAVMNLDPKGTTGRATVDLHGRLDPDWRADVREVLRRAADVAGLKPLLAARNMILSAEEATLSRIGSAQGRNDTKPSPAITFEVPRSGTHAASDSRSDLPREAELQSLPISGRCADSPGSIWRNPPTTAPERSPNEEPKLVRLAGVSTTPLPDSDASSSSFVPIAAGLLVDIFPCDLAALELGMQHFLEEVGSVSQWVVRETCAAQPAGWLLATMVGGAIAAEVIHQRQRTPASQRISGANDDSYWSFPSHLAELAPQVP